MAQSNDEKYEQVLNAWDQYKEGLTLLRTLRRTNDFFMRVVYYKYNCGEESLESIGHALGITRERVRQLISKYEHDNR